MPKAIFAAGCFWGVEDDFRKVPGVDDVVVGYCGGVTENPTYEAVCAGDTGHAEAVEVTYDERKVGYEQLLDVFWACHDPTQLNFQGWDIGTQYRSAIFTLDAEQEETARAAKRAEHASGRHRGEIVTEITPAKTFWPAEAYHQQYLAKRRGRGFLRRLFG